MNDSENDVRHRALLRLAGIFRIPVSALSLDLRFGTELKASFVSDFRRNELDMVGDDIRDVADRAVIKELESGRLVIQTVGDYCDHMVRCRKVNPKGVRMLFESDDRERGHSVGPV